MILDGSSGVYVRGILQDRVQHNMIKINRLLCDGEEVRYIVPLFYNAIKSIYDYGMHCKVELNLIEKVNNRFRRFYEENQERLMKLDQVHAYMLEECFEMLQSRQIMYRSELKRSKALTKTGENQNWEGSQDRIVLPQEIYYLQEQFSMNLELSQQIVKVSGGRMDLRPISLDEIPGYGHSVRQVELLWQNVQKLYGQHRVDEACAQCQKYQNLLYLYDPNAKLSQQRYEMIQKITVQQGLIKKYYQYFNEPGYVFDKEEDGVSMWYRINEEKKQVAIRIEAELDISVQNFMCIATEVDLFSEYVPYAYDTKQIVRVARNQKVGLTRVYVPILSNRQAYFFAVAYDRLATHNSIFFYSRTITSDVDFLRRLNLVIKRDTELVQLQYKFYILEYVPLRQGRGRVRLATNIDMKLNFLPLFIINKMIRVFSFDYIKNLIEVNQKFKGSAWEEKMRERGEIYDFFKARISEYLSSR